MIHPGMPPGMPPPGAPGPGPANPQQAALIMRLMHGAGAGGPGGPGGEPDADDTPGNGKGMSPLELVQSITQDIHSAMVHIPDPEIVNVLAGCLKAVTGVQQKLMATQSGGK